MAELKPGNKAPRFSLQDDQGKTWSLPDFQGKWLVLYFYPKDNTSGCTREAKEFTEALAKFKRLGALVAGVSPDSTASHGRFREKHGLKVLLLSDPEKKAIQAYGAWGKKKMAGREYEGVIRSTVLVDPEGKVARRWPKVKVQGHVEEVLQALKELRKK